MKEFSEFQPSEWAEDGILVGAKRSRRRHSQRRVRTPVVWAVSVVAMGATVSGFAVSVPQAFAVDRMTVATSERLESLGPGTDQRLETQPMWMRPVLDRMRALEGLSENWDRRGSRAVKHRATKAAEDFLARYAADAVVPPQIVPTRDEGLQLEWHARGVDLEVRISRRGDAHVLIEDADEGTEWDGPMSTAWPRLEKVLAKLS